VTEFADRYPAVEIEVVLNDRNLDLIDEDLHVGVRIGRLADSGLIARRVGEVRRVLVATPGYVAARGAPRTPADLSRHDIILGTATASAAEWRFGPTERGAVVRLAPRLRVNDVEAMLTAAKAGRGVARVLSYQVADELADGSLVRVLAAFEQPALPVQLVTPGGRHLAAKVRAFVDYAADRLGRLRVLRTEASAKPSSLFRIVRCQYPAASVPRWRGSVAPAQPPSGAAMMEFAEPEVRATRIECPRSRNRRSVSGEKPRSAKTWSGSH
jgi:hypothetical protein